MPNLRLTEELMPKLAQQELLRLWQNYEIATGLLSQEATRRRRIEELAKQPPPALPIALPPEFGWLSEDPSDRHELIQREPYDPVWSPTTESQLRTYIDAHPEFTEEYGYPTINCRTTMCEIAVVAYDGGSSVNLARTSVDTEIQIGLSFRSTISSFADQAVAEQFDYSPSGIHADIHREDGVTTILWHLKKEEED